MLTHTTATTSAAIARREVNNRLLHVGEEGEGGGGETGEAHTSIVEANVCVDASVGRVREDRERCWKGAEDAVLLMGAAVAATAVAATAVAVVAAGATAPSSGLLSDS